MGLEPRRHQDLYHDPTVGAIGVMPQFCEEIPDFALFTALVHA